MRVRGREKGGHAYRLVRGDSISGSPECPPFSCIRNRLLTRAALNYRRRPKPRPLGLKPPLGRPNLWP